MLDGLFHRHGFLHAQPQPHARLDLDPEIQRVRIAAHHRVGRRPVGRGADPHRTHGRRGRTRHRGALALQGGQPGSPNQRNVAGTPARTARGHHAFAGAALRRQAGLGRDLRLHAQRRPAEIARGGFAPGLRVRHPHLAGFHVRGGQGQQPGGLDPRTAPQRRHRRNPDPEEPDAQVRLAQLRSHVEGPQQDQVLPARRAGQTYAHGTRRARTQAQELEIHADHRRGGGLPGQILQGSHRHGGLRTDRHAESRLGHDQGDPRPPYFG